MNRGPGCRGRMYTLLETVMEYSEGTMETFEFSTLICWKWLGTNHKQVSLNSASAMCCAWGKNAICNVRNSRYGIDGTGMYHFFYTSPKFPDIFQGIYRYIVNLWITCVNSIVHYWHHAKFSTCRLLTIWALKQNGRQAWLKVQYLVILVA